MKGYVDPARISTHPIAGWVEADYAGEPVLGLPEALRAIADGKVVERTSGQGGVGTRYCIDVDNPCAPSHPGTFRVVK